MNKPFLWNEREPKPKEQTFDELNYFTNFQKLDSPLEIFQIVEKEG